MAEEAGVEEPANAIVAVNLLAVSPHVQQFGL
jgi:hypothetical protein